jgi:predicted transposase/invertase (TIGR01784 family)
MAREYFEKHLPLAFRKLVALETLTPQPESFVGDDLRLQTADMLFKVQLKTPLNPSGASQEGYQEGYLYTLVEHLSSPDPLLPFRLLKYMVAIWDHHLKGKSRPKQKPPPQLSSHSHEETGRLPLIVPFVLYTGERRFGPSQAFFDLFGSHKSLAAAVLQDPFAMLDLSQTSARDLEAYPLLQPALLMAKYIYALRHADVALLTWLLEKAAELALQGEEDYARSIVVYAAEAGDIPNKALLVQAIESTFKGGIAMNLLKEFEKDGLQKGLQQGKLEGRLEGMEQEKQAIALKLLDKGLSLELIEEATGLPLERLRNLRTVH